MQLVYLVIPYVRGPVWCDTTSVHTWCTWCMWCMWKAVP